MRQHQWFATRRPSPIVAQADYVMCRNGLATVYPATGSTIWIDPVSGLLKGAFSGPEAQEICGVYSLNIEADGLPSPPSSPLSGTENSAERCQ